MNFDSTHIVIRERQFGEILDLALRLFAIHWRPLVVAWGVGVAPWVVVNYFLFDSLIRDERLWLEPGTYLFWMLTAIVAELPLATAPMTLYLGQVTFAEKTSAGHIVRDFWRSLPQLIWYQVVWRGLLGVFLFPVAITHIWWPYLNELVLLERNPFLSGSKHLLTTRRRSRNLHRGVAGELLARWCASLAVAVLLFAALAGGIQMIVWHLSGYWMPGLAAFRVLMPLAAWLVAGYFAVVRFLAYLDLRIRREGWEVELTLRTEAERIVKAA